MENPVCLGAQEQLKQITVCRLTITALPLSVLTVPRAPYYPYGDFIVSLATEDVLSQVGKGEQDENAEDSLMGAGRLWI